MGTNTLGQLGPRCALWEDVKPETSFKPVDLLGATGYNSEEWTPVTIACTWTTSFVVYQRKAGGVSQSGEQGAEREEIVLACGSNDFGELGHEPVLEGHASDLPTLIDLGLAPGETVKLLKGGQRHVIAIIHRPDGQRVIGWGSARKGELDPSHQPLSGHNTSTKGKGKGHAYPKTLPPTILDVEIPPALQVIDIAVGVSHTLLLLSDGSLRFWGSNTHGQITGLGDMLGVKQIGATWNGSYLLTENGPRSQGSNNHGQLLRPSTDISTSRSIPSPDGLQLAKLACGSEHVLLACKGGQGDELWTGGWNEHGNLGLGDQVDRAGLERVELGSGVIKGVWAGCAASWVWMD